MHAHIRKQSKKYIEIPSNITVLANVIHCYETRVSQYPRRNPGQTVCNHRTTQCENRTLLKISVQHWNNFNAFIVTKLLTPWSICNDIVVMSTFHSLIRQRGHYDGWCMRSRKYFPSGAPYFTSGFHRGTCCSDICVRPYFMQLSFILDVECWLFLLFDCVNSLYLEICIK